MPPSRGGICNCKFRLVSVLLVLFPTPKEQAQPSQTKKRSAEQRDRSQDRIELPKPIGPSR